MIEVKVSNGKAYCKYGYVYQGKLVLASKIKMAENTLADFKICLEVASLKGYGVMNMETEMVDRELHIHKVFGITGAGYDLSLH